MANAPQKQQAMIKTIRQQKQKPLRVANVGTFQHVQSHLAVTPSEMNRMRESGIPISSQVDPTKFYDGDSSSFVSIDPMLMRGVDILDAWNAEQNAKNRLANAHTNDVKVYGK